MDVYDVVHERRSFKMLNFQQHSLKCDKYCSALTESSYFLLVPIARLFINDITVLVEVIFIEDFERDRFDMFGKLGIRNPLNNLVTD